MNEKQARTVAMVLGGLIYHTGGDLWIVIKERNDGTAIVISDDLIAEYANRLAYDAGEEPTVEILLVD